LVTKRKPEGFSSSKTMGSGGEAGGGPAVAHTPWRPVPAKSSRPITADFIATLKTPPFRMA
jgi:hypothetical protein